VQDAGTQQFGLWTPLRVDEAVQLFAGAPFRWWVTGGHALELHLGRSWREHGDFDVGICRRDAEQVHRWLSDWDVVVAAEGRLTPWRGQPLSRVRNHNNLWCRPSEDANWRLDIAVGSGTDHRWVYRRDESFSRPWEQTILQTTDDVPYLAPELQLLFKSKGLRDKDHSDARQVIPDLDETRRRHLTTLLPPTHPWQHLLTGGPQVHSAD
jgi:hypothetical protein